MQAWSRDRDRKVERREEKRETDGEVGSKESAKGGKKVPSGSCTLGVRVQSWPQVVRRNARSFRYYVMQKGERVQGYGKDQLSTSLGWTLRGPIVFWNSVLCCKIIFEYR